jgi:hypothetical protein
VLLPTDYVSEYALAADLPPHFLGRADDLFAAVRSADGTRLSAPIPLASTTPEAPDPEAMFAENEIGITGIEGDILWNAKAQEIEIKGVGLAVGMQVAFSRQLRNGQVERMTVPLRPGSLKATPPESFVRYPSPRLWEQRQVGSLKI